MACPRIPGWLKVLGWPRILEQLRLLGWLEGPEVAESPGVSDGPTVSDGHTLHPPQLQHLAGQTHFQPLHLQQHCPRLFLTVPAPETHFSNVIFPGSPALCSPRHPPPRGTFGTPLPGSQQLLTPGHAGAKAR